MRCGIAHMLSYILQRNLILHILFHKGNALLYKIRFSHLLYFSELINILQRSQKMHQAKANIFQVLRTISHFQVLIHFFK